MLVALLLLVPVAYLLGTFPSAVLAARSRGHDVLAEGSRNPGASNVARLVGWRAGALVAGADFAKGAAAAGLGLAVYGRAGAYALGIAAVLGHVAPVTRRFRGGKGVATAGGALVVLFPWIVLGLAVLWFFVARVLKRASIASIAATVAFPFAVWLSGYDRREAIVIAALAVLVISRHAANLRRLVRGEEPTLEARPDADPDADSP